MNIYVTEVQEDFGDYSKGMREVFVLPSTIPVENTSYLLGRIRTKTYGNWKRLDRKVISVEPLTHIAQVQFTWRLKFISTKLDGEKDQIFIFAHSVDHDTMYEIITDFEEGANGEDTGFRARLGAGFTDLKTCWGESITLRLPCRDPEDTQLLKSFIPS